MAPPLDSLSSPLDPQNDVEGSVQDFDAALAARPSIRPYLWQRGLSLYYLQRYADGAQQVRTLRARGHSLREGYCSSECSFRPTESATAL